MKGREPGAWDAFDLVLAALFAAGLFYYYAAGLVDENRALSGASAFAFLVFAAAVFLVRLFL